jgi:hypothetical protein
MTVRRLQKALKYYYVGDFKCHITFGMTLGRLESLYHYSYSTLYLIIKNGENFTNPLELLRFLQTLSQCLKSLTFV